jgi:hypothetical protein
MKLASKNHKRLASLLNEDSVQDLRKLPVTQNISKQTRIYNKLTAISDE